MTEKRRLAFEKMRKARIEQLANNKNMQDDEKTEDGEDNDNNQDTQDTQDNQYDDNQDNDNEPDLDKVANDVNQYNTALVNSGVESVKLDDNMYEFQHIHGN